MASRLPLWHRIAVLAAVGTVSALILVWGYVLNVGTLRVDAAPGDTITVDGRAFPGEGSVRAGSRRVRVERPNHVPFITQVDVPRSGRAEVLPEMTFQPYRSATRSVLRPLLPTEQQAEGYIEYPGLLAHYPTTDGSLALPPVDAPAVLRARFADDFQGMWAAHVQGEETVRTASTSWRGETTGRSFAGADFFAAQPEGEGTVISRLTDTGSLEPLGVVEGRGTFTLVPAPDGARVLAINDETGVASLVGTGGRTRLQLSHAVLDGRWSSDGAKLLLQVRMPGANAQVRLALVDVETGEETLLDVRAPLALAAFTPEGDLYAIEREATAESSRDEVQRQLTDARAQRLAEDVERRLLSFGEFQDMLPADLRARAELVRIDGTTGERSEIVVEGIELTSESLRLEAGSEPGTLLVLFPGSIDTLRYAP